MISEKELIGILSKVLGGGETTAQKKVEPLSLPENPALAKDGVAWVNMGEIYVRDPEEGGKMATIAPTPDTNLYVNGVLQIAPVQVSSADLIEVKLEKKEIAGKYKLIISADKMEASMFIEPTRLLVCILDDQESQNYLVLTASVREELISPIDLEQVNEMLAKANVVKGIDYSQIVEFIRSPERKKVVLARGVPAVPPKDESVEVLFPANVDYAPAVKEDGTVDFHELKRVISVEEGILLAEKHPGAPGAPGYNVAGEPVMPPESHKVVLNAGKGAFLDEGGKTVRSGRIGRPVVKKSGLVCFISVEDVLIHDGNVDIKSGNLRFKGSLLVVHGNVDESMTVHTTGLVIVDGIVTGAKIIANDKIHISGNSVNSLVSSGVSGEFIEKALGYLQELKKGFRQIADIVKNLSTQEKVKNSRISYGYMVKLVMEKRFNEVPENVSKINHLIKSFFEDMPDEVEKAILTINKAVADPHRITTDDDFSETLQDIDLLWNFFNSKHSNKADLDIAGAVNCHLLATGNATIRRNGCFNTTIEAGGNVKISSVFRGGSILAGGSVWIEQAGTETAVRTVIEVGDKGEVRIKQCNEGVIIKVGNRLGRVMSKARDLIARIDRKGNLEIVFFRAEKNRIMKEGVGRTYDT